MKLSEFITRLKLQIPNVNQVGMDDAALTNMLNQACDAVNEYTKIYSGYTDFNIVAEQKAYKLSVNVPNYLGTDKRGLFFRDSDDNWQDVIPKTRAWISEKYPDFLNASSTALPRWYWMDGDSLEFHEPPSTAYTLGCRLYHLLKREDMTGGDDYPFSGSAVEITAFRPLDDSILAYARWKISPAFGQVRDVDLRYQEYIGELKRGAMQIKRRRDLTNDSSNRMQI